MRAARDAGINFLDDARYNDETGSAPIPTGYSEVLFGELFRSAGWKRDETIVSNKLWWEFWPEQDAAAELDGSLGRMGFDYIDVIYANPPPEDLSLDEMVGSVNGPHHDGAGAGVGHRQLAGRAAARGRLAPRPASVLLNRVPRSCPTALSAATGWRGPRCRRRCSACGAPVVAVVHAGGRRR